MSRPLSIFASCVLAALAAACANTASQVATNQLGASEASAPGVHNGAFIVKLGADTIWAEKFTRTDNSYSVEQAVRSPTARLFHTHVVLKPSGDLAELSYMQHSIGPNLGPVLATTDVKVTGDSAQLLGKRGDSTVVN